MERTKNELKGSAAGGIENPTTGFGESRNTPLGKPDFHRFFTDLTDSVLLKSSTLDDISNGIINQYISGTTQTFTGNKIFNNIATFNRGIQVKNLPADINSISILGHEGLSDSYILKLPDTLPSIGESLRIKDNIGSVYELEWSSNGNATVISSSENSLAICQGGEVISGIGVNLSLNSKVTLPEETDKTYAIPAIGTGSSAEFVMTRANQTVLGHKVFDDLTASNQIKIGGLSEYISIKASPSMTYVLNLPSVAPTTSLQLLTAKENQIGYLDVVQPSGTSTNGIALTDSGLKLTYAGSSHPGIVSIGSQVFSGEKIFNDSVTPLNGVKFKSNGVGSTTLKCASNQTSDLEFKLPNSNGVVGQVLSLVSSGQLGWIDQTSITALESKIADLELRLSNLENI